MSVYMSSHKKRKNFPFPLFGFLSLICSIGLFIYISQTGTTAADFFGFGPDESITGLIGISLVVFAFLNYLLSIGIIVEIQNRFKFPLYLTQFIFFALTGLTGYFTGTEFFDIFTNLMMTAGTLYFLIMLIYLIIQRRAYSRYYSISVMTVTCLPFVPFLYGLFRFFAKGENFFTDTFWAFDNIVIYVLILTMLLYTTVNSIYLFYINRKVY